MQLFFDFGGAPDVVQNMHHRLRGGFNDIGRQAHAMEATAVVIDHDIHLTQRIFAVALGRQVIFDQLNVVLGDAINRLVNRIDRAVTVSCLCFNFISAGQLDRGGSDVAGPDCTLK